MGAGAGKTLLWCEANCSPSVTLPQMFGLRGVYYRMPLSLVLNPFSFSSFWMHSQLHYCHQIVKLSTWSSYCLRGPAVSFSRTICLHPHLFHWDKRLWADLAGVKKLSQFWIVFFKGIYSDWRPPKCLLSLTYPFGNESRHNSPLIYPKWIHFRPHLMMITTAMSTKPHEYILNCPIICFAILIGSYLYFFQVFKVYNF